MFSAAFLSKHIGELKENNIKANITLNIKDSEASYINWSDHTNYKHFSLMKEENMRIYG